MCCYRLVNQVARPGHKKKARMARTRSDFLTRGSNPEGEGESEDDEYDETPLTPPLSPSLPHPEQDAEGGDVQACHSDSEMVIVTARRHPGPRAFSGSPD